MATHSQPTATAATRLASARARTISGLPGKATAVETSTTGLTAGEDSRKASAADGATPRPIRRWATGTEPHSQPGSAAPATAATGTARTGWRGSIRVIQAAGTNAVTTPLTATPSTRNGTA